MACWDKSILYFEKLYLGMLRSTRTIGVYPHQLVGSDPEAAAVLLHDSNDNDSSQFSESIIHFSINFALHLARSIKL